MSGRHSVPIRGLLGTAGSELFQGTFGRMFRQLPEASFGNSEARNEAALKALGQAMSADFDGPKDGQDAEESGIPALYTYFGQFVDHDITFDPASSLMKQNDPDALVDFRTPAFDLDNVYGRGPDDQPYMYDKLSFVLGNAITGGAPAAKDLARGPNGRALIGDPRNDENTIVSQFQGLVLRFHNRVVRENPRASFDALQRHVRFHYQYVVLNDFLPRIVHSSVIDSLKTAGRYDRSKLRFYHWRNTPFMPVEFSVAAYRLGHSMIRPGYRLNDAILLPIFPVRNEGLREGLTGFRPMIPDWGIDWGRFIDIDTRRHDGGAADKKRRLQFAYRLDTSLVNPLANLPPSVATNPASLAERNLLRGWRLGLPSGQAVARAMALTPLPDREIVIGEAVDRPEKGDIVGTIDKVADGAFKGNCPLWTYILAEAMRHKEDVVIPVTEKKKIKTPRLGPVGGRIVAEVFLGLMFGDPNSMLNVDPLWHPEGNPGYALRDFVRYALG